LGRFGRKKNGHSLSMRMLFDDLVGAGEHCGRDRDADLSRYLEVKDQLEPGGLLGRRIAGARALHCANAGRTQAASTNKAAIRLIR
jgi:hypothetical protein